MVRTYMAHPLFDPLEGFSVLRTQYGVHVEWEVYLTQLDLSAFRSCRQHSTLPKHRTSWIYALLSNLAGP